MLKLIIGVKGTGKTKTIIDMANAALDESKGSVVFVEKGTKLIHEVKYQARLMDSDEYDITNAETLYGFIAGIYASNHDVTHIFIDSALKICKNDIVAFERFIEKSAAFGDKNDIKLIYTSSIPVEEASEIVKKYL